MKARTHARVASALPHSEGIAYKSLSGEIAMCRRVGRMGPISVDGPGQNNPVRSESPWGGVEPHSKAAHRGVVGPAQNGTTEFEL